MEENLVDSAKYKLYLHSLDSRFADMREDQNSTFRLVLPYPLKNIMRVRLASIELPLVEYMFSEQYGNLTFSVNLDSNGFVSMQSIIPGNYTPQELVTVIQTNLKLIDNGFSCVLNSYTNTCTIKHSSKSFILNMLSSTNSTVANRPSFWGLGYYLGFRQSSLTSNLNTDGSYSLTGTSPINTDPNQYYLLQLYYPDSIVNVWHRYQDKSYIEAFAKVILKNGAYTITYDDNSNMVRKEFTFLAPVTMSQIKVKLLNPYGESINMLNTEWSVTLEITEIVNSKTYMKLSNTYSNK